MANCSNLLTSQSVSLTAGTLTEGFCHTSLQTTYEEFIARTTAAISAGGTTTLGSFTAGDDTPSASDQGKLWFKQDASDCNNIHGWHYYNAASSLANKWEPVGMPVGSILMWAVATPPFNWLVCDGATFTEADYPLLYAALGDSTTLPNLKGRSPIGAGQAEDVKWTSGSDYTTDGTDFAIGTEYGTEDHLQTGAESGTSAHSHIQKCVNQVGDGGGNYISGTNSNTTLHTGTHPTYDSTEADASSAHENMSPFVVVGGYIIKT